MAAVVPMAAAVPSKGGREREEDGGEGRGGGREEGGDRGRRDGTQKEVEREREQLLPFPRIWGDTASRVFHGRGRRINR